MSSYCLKCRTNTESKNPKVVKTKIDFPVDYRAFDASSIINIYKYLMKKHDMK